jgi:hypothetical protein
LLRFAADATQRQRDGASCRLAGAIMFGDKLEDRSEIPLEFARDSATGEWRAIRWVT